MNDNKIKARREKILHFVKEDCEIILDYFQKDPFFLNQMTMDAICMRIIDIGSKVSEAEEMNLPLPYGVDWKEAKRMRDKIAHHYEGADPDKVQDTCKNDIPALLEGLKKASE